MLEFYDQYTFLTPAKKRAVHYFCHDQGMLASRYVGLQSLLDLQKKHYATRPYC